MKKVYLASGISDKARKRYQKEVAEKIEALGYEVYAASRNDSINDKSNDPTVRDIYKGDIDWILQADILAHIISGAGEDGTNFEVGAASGINEERTRYNFTIDRAIELIEQGNIEKAKEILKDVKKEPIKIVSYTSNERLMIPQFYKGNKENIKGLASAGYNHLILGGIDKWGEFVGIEEDMIERMKELAFFNKRIKEPNDWDSIYSYEDTTTLYACKYCHTIVEERPGYIKKINDHICHSFNIPMRGYISLEKIIENKKNWEEIKEKCNKER